MKVSFFDNQHFSTTQWSGGSTRQLFVSPPNASIAKRNFDVRLSTAIVEVEESTFTSLEGVHRKLMVLEGEIELSHQDHHTSRLKPFEVDVFSGDWKTFCIGTCVDFNLMTTGDVQSDLSSLHLAKNSESILRLEENWKTLCLFVVAGSIELTFEDKKYAIGNDQLLIIEDLNVFEFQMDVNSECKIVLVKID
jgi:environmental stress-induced protein Ves